MNTPPRLVHLALGANLGDREATIRAAIQAVDALAKTCVVASSSLHETTAVTLGDESSSTAQPDYLNGAITIETSLSLRELLQELQAIERSFGRVRAEGQRWEARTLDLDILLDGDTAIDEPGLTVPHPRMHERRFVLAPLIEIAPDAMHPGLELTMRQLLEQLDD